MVPYDLARTSEVLGCITESLNTVGSLPLYATVSSKEDLLNSSFAPILTPPGNRYKVEQMSKDICSNIGIGSGQNYFNKVTL